jgi:hypothetical protein
VKEKESTQFFVQVQHILQEIVHRTQSLDGSFAAVTNAVAETERQL